MAKRYAELTGNRKKCEIKSSHGNTLDYRGEIIVALHNDDLINKRHVEEGDRIAQLVIQPCMPVILQQVDELPGTERGAGGFGSTDKPSGAWYNKNTASGSGVFDYEQITLYEIIKENGGNK